MKQIDRSDEIVCRKRPSFTPLGSMDIAKFEKLIRSLAKKYKAPGVDLEDLEQEARVATYLALKEYKGDGDSRTQASFVTGKIKDVLKEYRRKNLDETVSLDAALSADDEDLVSLHDAIGIPASQESAVATKELEKLLKKVSPELQTVISMRAEGRSGAEIAKAIGKSEEVTEQIYQRQVKPLLEQAAA